MMNTVVAAAHNGIAAYSMAGAGICTGTLVFAVGFRNEPAPLAGITHLIEHVLLRMVHPMPMSHGGTVDVDSVEFYATGEGDVVAGFLNAIAAAIVGFAAVSEQDLELEKSVVEAEDPLAYCRVSGGLLTYRFGMSGLGAGEFGAPSTFGLSRAEMIDWVGRWFTANNAAITFTGTMPDSLNIRLPDGAPINRGLDKPLITRPTVIRSSKEGVAFSFIVPTDNSSLLAEALKYELLDRLSHTSGLIYSVDIITTVVDDGRCQLDLVLDPVETNVPAAFAAGVAAIRDVASNGFSANAMLQARSILQAELAWEGTAATISYVDQLAVDRLLGRPTSTPQEILDRAAEVTPKVLTATLQTGMETLIVAVDKYAKVRKRDIKAMAMALDPYEIWQPSANGPERKAVQESGDRHQIWRYKSSKSILWLTPARLWRQESGKTKSIDLTDVVLVGERSCGCISLTDSRGRTTQIATEDLKRGKMLRERLLSEFADRAIRKFPEQ